MVPHSSSLLVNAIPGLVNVFACCADNQLNVTNDAPTMGTP